MWNNLATKRILHLTSLCHSILLFVVRCFHLLVNVPTYIYIRFLLHTYVTKHNNMNLFSSLLFVASAAVAHARDASNANAHLRGVAGAIAVESPSLFRERWDNWGERECSASNRCPKRDYGRCCKEVSEQYLDALSEVQIIGRASNQRYYRFDLVL